MTAQLQKLWIFYYVTTHYSSVLLRSLHYYRPGLIILTRKEDVMVKRFSYFYNSDFQPIC